ncbi:MAG: hypothetical protein U9N56_04855 [Actinomycetota bacterium]|nr:hypothetical protein [Actinomycetota bacterium]
MSDIERHDADSEEQAIEEWFHGDPVNPKDSTGRRWVIWVVAAVTALALAIVPLYNLFDRAQPQIADNGLEVCGFDYCVVQDAMTSLGMGEEMVRLTNVYLTDEDAADLVDLLVAGLGVRPVELVMVDRLDGQIAGQYDPASRTIFIERPATAWIVAHEVAHVSSGGHENDFNSTLADLAAALAGS